MADDHGATARRTAVSVLLVWPGFDQVQLRGVGDDSMIVEQVIFEAHSLDRLLDEYEYKPRRGDRDRLLFDGLMISQRALMALVDEPLIANTHEYLRELELRTAGNVYQAAEELRHDAAMLRMFISAECRLLFDLGLPASAVDRTRRLLEDVLSAARAGADGLSSKVADLIGQLEQDLQQVGNDRRHGVLRERIVGVLEALCGAAIVGANAAVGATTAAATAGITVIGAGISVEAGAEVMTRGVDRAMSQ